MALQGGLLKVRFFQTTVAMLIVQSDYFSNRLLRRRLIF